MRFLILKWEWEIKSGNRCTTGWMYLRLLNYTLENNLNDFFKELKKTIKSGRIQGVPGCGESGGGVCQISLFLTHTPAILHPLWLSNTSNPR